MNNRTCRSRSTSFLVAVGCAHGVLPRRVELPLEEYQEGGLRVVRAYLPGADPSRDIVVTRQGSELVVRCRRRVENLECECADLHRVTFEKVWSLPAGTAPDDVAARYAAGCLFVSWPMDPSSAPMEKDARHAPASRGTVNVRVRHMAAAD
jgi:HSP20 family molecular chaperone IbpA